MIRSRRWGGVAGFVFLLVIAGAVEGQPAVLPVSPITPAAETRLVNDEIAACEGCHGDPKLGSEDKAKKGKSLFVDEAVFRNSRHEKVACTQCHADVNPDDLPHAATLKKVECGSCHLEKKLPRTPGFSAEIFKAYGDSIHGSAFAAGDPDAPRCADCHGHHDIRRPSDPVSPVSHANVPKTCVRCHDDAKVAGRHQGFQGYSKGSYQNSVHGALLKEGKNGEKSARDKAPAICIDCHGVHGIRPGSDPNSSVTRAHIPDTCGKCHQEIFREWKESIHGQLSRKGNKESPVCTTCHGEHTIRSPGDQASSVNSAHVVATCSHCHENAALQRQIGLPTERLGTYRESFHGIQNRLGLNQVAHCASCHGSHNIQPSSDPRSLVNKENLPRTCGSCHPGIGKGVALGKVHLLGTFSSSPIHWAVKMGYLVLILGLIGFFVTYILLDLWNYRRGRVSHAVSRHQPDDPLGLREVERFSPAEKWQHILLLTSFTLLIITGLPLRYTDTLWVDRLLHLPYLVVVRGLLHRAAAVVMMATACFHLVYLFLTRRGRSQLGAILWRGKDFSDIFAMIKCYLGLSQEKPRFAKFNWIEKMEYFAVVWGTFIMSATGLLLWFENEALVLIPMWTWQLARITHSYESLLAFLSIIIWHLYHVHLKPGVFPMSRVWLTGKISLRHLEEEHPLEFERLMKEEASSSGPTR